MKNVLVICFMLGFFIHYVNGQTPKDKLKEIDRLKDSIEANKESFTKTEKVNNGVDLKWVYKDNGGIVLIEVTTLDENLIKHVEWYFNQNRLCYAEQEWRIPIENKITDRQKFYISEGKLINWVKNGLTVSPDCAEFKEVSAQLAAYAETLLKEE